MYKLYSHSPKVKITDAFGRSIDKLAIYDPELLVSHLLSVNLKGSTKDTSRVKNAIYHFIEHWEAGERKITVSFGDFSIIVYPTDFIEEEHDLVSLGIRPGNPEREVKSAMGRLTRAMNYKSPNITDIYQELQDVLKKYPTLPFKEQA